MKITREFKFRIGEFVYIKHDIEQIPRMITAIKLRANDYLYEVASGITDSMHFEFELSSEKLINYICN